VSREAQWSAPELQVVLLSVLSRPGSVWHTDEGRDLLAQVDRFLAPQIARWVRSLHGYDMEPAEVNHSVALHLVDPNASAALRKGVSTADNAWAYLAICTRRWAAREAGHRVGELDALLNLPAAPNSSADASLAPEHGLTPLDTVIAKTTRVVTTFVDASDHRPFDEAIRWFAENPITHQGHGHADAKRAPELLTLGFTPNDVAALARVTWGGRPNMHITSLLHAFLIDEDFNPHASRPHRTALMQMRRTLRAGAVERDTSQMVSADASP